MFENDEYGLFGNSEHQIANFLYYMETLYNDEFSNYKYFALPENELAFIYIVSEIFEFPLIQNYHSLKDLTDIVSDKLDELEENKKQMINYAFNFLNFTIKVDDTRRLPLTYGVVLKNAIDILAGNNDIVLFKQYEVVNIVRNYQEQIMSINYNYELE